MGGSAAAHTDGWRGAGVGKGFGCLAASLNLRYWLYKMAQGKRWVFTVHFPFNPVIPTEAGRRMQAIAAGKEFLVARAAPPLWGVYGGCQLEVCPTTERVHAQGFVVFDKNHRLAACKKVHGTAHWELMKGTTEDSEKYCSKEETRVPDTHPVVWGVKPVAEQGRRTDLEDAIASLQAAAGPPAKRLKAVARAHPAAYVKFHRGLESLAAQLVGPVSLPKPEWRPWQASLEESLAAEPDNRTIRWFTDFAGGQGKSTFVSYYVCNEECDAVLLSGKVADMAYTYNSERVVFFDVTRTQAEHMDHLYAFAESLKNGVIHSTKYVPVLKTFKPPHVVFFSNSGPMPGKWSADRLIEVEL